jgi:hypothetical protein
MLSIKNKILPAIIILLSVSTGYFYWRSMQTVNVGYSECKERYEDCYRVTKDCFSITTHDVDADAWYWGNKNPDEEYFLTEKEAVLNCVLVSTSFN